MKKFKIKENSEEIKIKLKINKKDLKLLKDIHGFFGLEDYANDIKEQILNKLKEIK